MNPSAIEKPKLYSKLSKIGEIPEEWKVVKLGDACNQRNEIIQPTGKGDNKFVGLEHINPGEIGIRAYQLDTDVKSSKFRFYRGDILYGKLRPYLDKAAIADFEGICSTDLLVLTTKNNKALAEFLIYLIHSNQFIQNSISSTSGTNHPRTSWKEISKFKFGLPPLPEQRRIAEVLSTVDSAIQKVGGAIESTERLKKGLMQRLLTRGIGRERFEFSNELGCEIPVEWKVKTLINAVGKKNDLIVAGPFGSNLKVEDYRNEGIPIIRLQNIDYGRFVDKDIKYTSPEKATELSYHSFVKGDIVLAKLGDPIGKTCIVPDFLERGIVIADVVRIRIDEKFLNKKFIMYILNSFYAFNQLTRGVIGSTRPRVNLDQIRDLFVPLPPLPEQRRIAEILSAADRKLELERMRKEKLERVKKGLMNELLTGRKRIKVETDGNIY